MKILVINGPNLNMLGLREPDIYGRTTYADLCTFIENKCAELGSECELYQSNHEGDIVDAIQKAYGKTDGIVINPAAYTHTSVALFDAVKTDVPYNFMTESRHSVSAYSYALPPQFRAS